MLLPDKYEALTFDCYGTLIDWETGILAALTPVLSARGVRLDSPRILSLYAEAEAEAETRPYVRYREVLRKVVDRFGQVLGFAPSPSELDCLADSLGTWPPFPDTVEALRMLKNRYRLGIVSNVDDDLFALSSKLLEVDFDWVITAGRARSYKPSPSNFRLALETMDVPVERVLHVAESIRHDIAPAKALGLATEWVDRRGGLGGCVTASGNPPHPDVQADAVVPDLKSLAVLLSPTPRDGEGRV